MADGGLVDCLPVEFIHDGEAAFAHGDEELEFDAGGALVQAVFVFVSEVGFGGAPFFQGFDGDVELGIDALGIAFEFFEQVERLDFGSEGVAAFHGWAPFFTPTPRPPPP